MRRVMKMSPRILLLCAALSLAMPGMPASQTEAEVIESLEFREVDIKDVLRQLAKQYGLNIVFSESVKGMVTVQLTKVTVEQALDSIITVNGFAYTKKDTVYRVTSQEEAMREGRQTKLFRLNNADAVKLKETLSRMLSSSGSIEADMRSNSLLVTDSPITLDKIAEIIPSLDEKTSQVLIEAKIIETSLNKSEKLGIDWSTTVKATGSSRPTTFPFRKWGSDKDMYPVPEYSTSGDGSNVTVTSDFPFLGAQAYLSGQIVPGLGSFPMVSASEFAFGTLDFSALQMVFDALRTRSKTKLVANPRIVTINNQKAVINVGRSLSLPKYERNETTGRLEISGWQTQNIGVILDVTPQISREGYVRLKLRPEVSNLIGYASNRDGVNEGPITSSRAAETEVQIKDGQTVVIGGLVKDESFERETKVPILGDLPLVGWLFKRKEVSDSSNPTEKTDLLIFVTARILKDGDSAETDARKALASPRPFKLQKR